MTEVKISMTRSCKIQLDFQSPKNQDSPYNFYRITNTYSRERNDKINQTYKQTILCCTDRFNLSNNNKKDNCTPPMFLKKKKQFWTYIVKFFK